MPFRTDNVQATQLGNLAAFRFHTDFILHDSLSPDFRRNFQAARIEDPTVFVLQILQVGPSHEFRVPAQNNIRTPASHVGRNRKCALSACLSHDIGFPLVIFGV